MRFPLIFPLLILLIYSPPISSASTTLITLLSRNPSRYSHLIQLFQKSQLIPFINRLELDARARNVTKLNETEDGERWEHGWSGGVTLFAPTNGAIERLVLKGKEREQQAKERIGLLELGDEHVGDDDTMVGLGDWKLWDVSFWDHLDSLSTSTSEPHTRSPSQPHSNSLAPSLATNTHLELLRSHLLYHLLNHTFIPPPHRKNSTDTHSTLVSSPDDSNGSPVVTLHETLHLPPSPSDNSSLSSFSFTLDPDSGDGKNSTNSTIPKIHHTPLFGEGQKLRVLFEERLSKNGDAGHGEAEEAAHSKKDEWWSWHGRIKVAVDALGRGGIRVVSHKKDEGEKKSETESGGEKKGGREMDKGKDEDEGESLIQWTSSGRGCLVGIEDVLDLPGDVVSTLSSISLSYPGPKPNPIPEPKFSTQDHAPPSSPPPSSISSSPSASIFLSLLPPDLRSSWKVRSHLTLFVPTDDAWREMDWKRREGRRRRRMMSVGEDDPDEEEGWGLEMKYLFSPHSLPDRIELAARLSSIYPGTSLLSRNNTSPDGPSNSSSPTPLASSVSSNNNDDGSSSSSSSSPPIYHINWPWWGGGGGNNDTDEDDGGRDGRDNETVLVDPIRVGYLERLEGVDVSTTFNTTLSVRSAEHGNTQRPTVNGTQVEDWDVLAQNGVIHLIPSLESLLPSSFFSLTVEKYLFALNATRFVDLLRGANLTDYIRQQPDKYHHGDEDVEVGYTILAPRDDVSGLKEWEKIWWNEEDGGDEGRQKLKEVLKYHVVRGKWMVVIPESDDEDEDAKGIVLERMDEGDSHEKGKKGTERTTFDPRDGDIAETEMVSEEWLLGRRQAVQVGVKESEGSEDVGDGIISPEVKVRSGKKKRKERKVISWGGVGVIGQPVEVGNSIIYLLSRTMSLPPPPVQMALSLAPEHQLSTFVAALYSVEESTHLKPFTIQDQALVQRLSSSYSSPSPQLAFPSSPHADDLNALLLPAPLDPPSPSPSEPSPSPPSTDLSLTPLTTWFAPTNQAFNALGLAWSYLISTEGVESGDLAKMMRGLGVREERVWTKDLLSGDGSVEGNEKQMKEGEIRAWKSLDGNSSDIEDGMGIFLRRGGGGKPQTTTANVKKEDNNTLYFGTTRTKQSSPLIRSSSDLLTRSGVLHVIDGLVPVPIPDTVDVTISKLLRGAKARTMEDLVRRVNMSWILGNHHDHAKWPANTSFTILSPSDKAFSKINLTDYLDDEKKLTELVELHIVPVAIDPSSSSSTPSVDDVNPSGGPNSDGLLPISSIPLQLTDGLQVDTLLSIRLSSEGKSRRRRDEAKYSRLAFRKWGEGWLVGIRGGRSNKKNGLGDGGSGSDGSAGGGKGSEDGGGGDWARVLDWGRISGGWTREWRNISFTLSPEQHQRQQERWQIPSSSSSSLPPPSSPSPSPPPPPPPTLFTGGIISIDSVLIPYKPSWFWRSGWIYLVVFVVILLLALFLTGVWISWKRWRNKKGYVALANEEVEAGVEGVDASQGDGEDEEEEEESQPNGPRRFFGRRR